MLRIISVAILLTLQLSCSSPLTGFTCARDVDCMMEAQTGVCEANQRCSFADTSCHSGQRYGPVSGEDSDQCTPLLADAAMADAIPLPDTASVQDAGPVDANTDASTARLLTVVVTGTNQRTLRVRVDGESLANCEPQNQLTTTCYYDVTLGDAIEIRRDEEPPDSIEGTCPIDCVNLPCFFTMEEDCAFVGVFEALN